MGALDAIALAAKIIGLVVQIGANIPVVLSLVGKIKAWAAPNAPPPTQADFDELNAMEQTYLDMLNNTANDDPNAGQGAI